MSLDLRELLEDSAARPREHFDLDPLWRRGRRRKWARRISVLVAALSVGSLGFLAVSSGLPFDRAETPPVGQSFPAVDTTMIDLPGYFGGQVDVAPDGRAWVNSLGFLMRIDSDGNEFEITFEREAPMNLAIGSDALWLAGWTGDMGPGGGTPPSGFVRRVDLNSLPAAEGTVRPDDLVSTKVDSEKNEAPESIALGDDAAWVTERLGDVLWKLDLEDGRLLAKVPVDDSPIDVATGPGSVWVIHTTTDRLHHGQGGASLVEVDPSTNEVVGDPVDAGECPRSVEVSPDAVWVLDGCNQAVLRFNPRSHDLEATVDLDHSVADLAVGGGFVWVIGEEEGVVSRIDTESLEVDPRPIAVGRRPESIAYGESSAWVTTAEGVTRLDSVP